jgi:hypothetical protein
VQNGIMVNEGEKLALPGCVRRFHFFPDYDSIFITTKFMVPARTR